MPTCCSGSSTRTGFLGGRIRLDPEAAREAVRVHVAEPLGISVPEAAAGIKGIVDGRMADLLRTVTLERGHDPREFTLYAFGGAGPAHAPAFALELVEAIVVPATQSVHSALGAAASDVALRLERSAPMRLAREELGADADADEIEGIFAELEREAGERLSAQGVASASRSLRRVVEVRFVRQTKALEVSYGGSPPTLLQDFLRIYAQRYGQTAVPELAGFELVTFVVLARGALRRPRLSRARESAGDGAAARRGEREVYDPLAGAFLTTPIYRGRGAGGRHRARWPRGDPVREQHVGAVQRPARTGRPAAVGRGHKRPMSHPPPVPDDYVLGPSPADWERLERPLALDAVTFEILRHKLEAVNEEQAIALKDVSVSPIVTAASDFNNALYTADGRIASMGPQVVFHSGAMPIVLRHVMEAFPPEEIGEGDMFVVNDPYYGAVHHPDVSLVAPVHHEGRLIAWAGVAAHQVDMGGMSVGSISARAREKQQEGLMMPPIKLIEGGVLRHDVWRLILNMTPPAADGRARPARFHRLQLGRPRAAAPS